MKAELLQKLKIEQHRIVYTTMTLNALAHLAKNDMPAHLHKDLDICISALSGYCYHISSILDCLGPRDEESE